MWIETKKQAGNKKLTKEDSGSKWELPRDY
jgi:hypothetical protein